MSIAPLTTLQLLQHHHAWLHITGGLSLGDLAVALGTGALALFTYMLAKTTSDLDKKRVAREEEAHKREIRGICRLLDGELEIVQRSVESAVGERHWDVTSRTPHGAWDRNAALLLSELSMDQGLRFTSFFSILTDWEAFVARYRETNPAGALIPINPPADGSGDDALTRLRRDLSGVRRDLQQRAYQ